jgi:CRISPR-associated protein Cas6
MNAVDVLWPIRNAGRIPLHHQYHLFSAVSRLVPTVHECDKFGLHAIRGRSVGPGVLRLEPTSAVVIRTPPERLGTLLVLSGKKLQLAGASIHLGVPCVRALNPAVLLTSQLVTIKGYQEADEMMTGVRRQLDALSVLASVEILIGTRRIVRVKQQTIVGFRVSLNGVSDEESLCVQTNGIGGRRHLGCGLFSPVEERFKQPEVHSHE